MTAISKFIQGGALALVLGLGAGCLPSTITQNCEQIAQKQCDACESCATDDPRLDDASLCQLSEEEMSACEETLTARCEDLSSARQQPNEALESCVEALDDLTCERLHEASAQDRSPTVPACEVFL